MLAQEASSEFSINSKPRSTKLRITDEDATSDSDNGSGRDGDSAEE